MQTTAAKCTQSGNFKGSAEMVSGMALSWFENICRAFLVTQTNIFSGTKYVLAASWCLLRGQSHPGVGAIPYPQSISRELILPLALHCTTHNQTKYSVSSTQYSTKITARLELLAPQTFLAPLPILALTLPLHKKHYLALLAPKHLAAGPRDYPPRWLPSSE